MPKTPEKKDDLFKDERITITLESGVSSVLGYFEIKRHVSDAVAKKIFKMLTKKQRPNRDEDRD